MTENRPRRPRIAAVGDVREDDDGVIRIGGWGLSPCAANCPCHRHPENGQLTLLEDDANGLLGLVSHRDGCDCCEPWTADELTAVVRDLRQLSDWEATT